MVKYPSRVAILLFVALIVIGCEEKGLSPREKEIASRAVQTLRQVATAVEAGMDLKPYGALALDTKAKVDKALIALPEDEVSKEIKLALRAYIDAGIAWEAMLNQQYQEWHLLMAKYPIPPETSQPLNHNEVLKTIWSDARQHLDRASQLLGQ
jgi:hypothetical protein